MAVKVEVNEKKLKNYPKLMVSDDGCKVLFIETEVGVCVDKGNNPLNYIGEYSDRWAENEFTDFTGSITLSNE